MCVKVLLNAPCVLRNRKTKEILRVFRGTGIGCKRSLHMEEHHIHLRSYGIYSSLFRDPPRLVKFEAARTSKWREVAEVE